MEIVIRTSTREDLSEIIDLFYSTVLNVCKDDYSNDQIMAWASSASNKPKWLSKIDQTYFIVAVINDRIVGFASLADGNYFDVLYVHKDFQRLGIASKLLFEIEKTALEAQARVISSDVSITARPFFERNGYVLQRTNVNLINGVEVINFRMHKDILY